MIVDSWLAEFVKETSTPRPGGRNAKLIKCKACRRSVLRGLDADYCAFTATVDLAPLSKVGEALALLTGRSTYRLTRNLGRWRLMRRDGYMIASRHKLMITADVVADHVCDLEVSGTVESSFRKPLPDESGRDDIPPF